MSDRTAWAALQVRVYEVAVVDRFLAEAAAERTRLQQALAAASAGAAGARQRPADRVYDQDRVSAMVLAAERRQRFLDDEAARTVGRILADAEAEAEAILASVRPEQVDEPLGRPRAADVVDIRVVEVG